MAITLATSSALEDRTYGRRRSFGNAGDWCRRVDKWSVPRGTIHQGSLYCRRFGVFSDVENHVNNWTFNSKRALILGTATKQICFECSTWNAALWATPFLNSIMERLGVTRPTQRYLAIY